MLGSSSELLIPGAVENVSRFLRRAGLAACCFTHSGDSSASENGSPRGGLRGDGTETPRIPENQ